MTTTLLKCEDIILEQTKKMALGNILPPVYYLDVFGEEYDKEKKWFGFDVKTEKEYSIFLGCHAKNLESITMERALKLLQNYTVPFGGYQQCIHYIINKAGSMWWTRKDPRGYQILLCKQCPSVAGEGYKDSFNLLMTLACISARVAAGEEIKIEPINLSETQWIIYPAHDWLKEAYGFGIFSY